MLEWLAVVLLILFGLGLLVIELIFIPGTTFIGLLGLASCIYGIIMAYSYFGSFTGTMVLTGSLAIGLVTLYYSLKRGIWHHFSLKNVIKSRVNEEDETLKIGQQGVSRSALRPSGTVDFNGVVREVRTLGELLPSQSRVKIIKVQGKKIFVEQVEG